MLNCLEMFLLRFLFFNARKFMHSWLFIAFQDDSLIAVTINSCFGYQETDVFCGHFQLLELL